jgi:peptidoglycan-associated lipoprotein
MNTTTRVLLAAALVASLAACSKKVKEEAPVTETTTTTETAPAPDDGMFGPEDLDTNACLRQRVVYFDFDQDVLKPEFEEIMACHAKYLRDRPSARITLEGKLSVVSFGEERPTCTDASESCWSQNRRVEIVYTAK